VQLLARELEVALDSLLGEETLTVLDGRDQSNIMEIPEKDRKDRQRHRIDFNGQNEENKTIEWALRRHITPLQNITEKN